MLLLLTQDVCRRLGNPTVIAAAAVVQRRRAAAALSLYIEKAAPFEELKELPFLGTQNIISVYLAMPKRKNKTVLAPPDIQSPLCDVPSCKH